MRVSTSQVFDGGTLGIQRNQSSLYKLQNQLSTGRRILAPEDDPIGASEALKVQQSLSVNEQYMENQDNATSQLSLVESRLEGISSLILNVQARVVQAGNGSLTDLDRQAIASEIRQRYDELLSLANSQDGNDQYIFAGFRGATIPFGTSGAPGSRVATYNGDDGQRTLQVDTSRSMPVSQPGSDIFMRIRQGNGVFMSSPGAANQGTGVISTGSVVTGFDGSTYSLTFNNPPTTYNLSTTTPAGVTTVTPGLPFNSDSAITLGPAGQQIQISIGGTPAAGDTFAVAPSMNRDLFATLDSFIRTLETGIQGNQTATANFRNQLISIGDSLDQGLNNVLRIRTDVGARLLELESLKSVGEDTKLQFKSDLSRLQDLDYAQAITSMSQKKMTLEAAQLSFKQISQLSLFNYL